MFVMSKCEVSSCWFYFRALSDDGTLGANIEEDFLGKFLLLRLDMRKSSD